MGWKGKEVKVDNGGWRRGPGLKKSVKVCEGKTEIENRELGLESVIGCVLES